MLMLKALTLTLYFYIKVDQVQIKDAQPEAAAIYWFPIWCRALYYVRHVLLILTTSYKLCVIFFASKM